MSERVYRICETHVWARAQAEGELPLSELDLRDGYVHLSSAGQVASTLQRYFAGREDLVLLTIACDRLRAGDLLKFEAPTRATTTELFPHLYGRVPLQAIVASDPLVVEHGCHRVPAAIHQAQNR